MSDSNHISRRRFLETTATAGAALASTSLVPPASWGSESSVPTAESLVGQLYQTLTERQKNQVCFDWDHQDKKRGLLRTFVANNWNITKHEINSDFYTDEQRDIIRGVFEAIIHPEWHSRFDQQLDDDAGGFGNEQSIAIFGKPGDEGGKFEMVITGRHMTIRCDGDSADHVAFGGPIFYGHAPVFNEDPTHIDNVFWHQALAANDLYKVFDGRQQKQALVARTPREQAVSFRGEGGRFTGLPVTDMSPRPTRATAKSRRHPYRNVPSE